MDKTVLIDADAIVYSAGLPGWTVQPVSCLRFCRFPVSIPPKAPALLRSSPRSAMCPGFR